MLEGIHHITAITGDSAANLDFYVRILGLRLVKKTVNFDVPDIYHLYYADETGTPGSILTFFEYPGARRGRHGAGMIHTIQWGVAGEEAIDFWEKRLAAESVETSRRAGGDLRFEDPEGLGIELKVDYEGEPALAAQSPDVPAKHALRGFSGVRVYGAQNNAEASEALLTLALGFGRAGSEPAGFELTAGTRRAIYSYDADPGPGIQGGGTVHHIAWACGPEDQQDWRRRVLEAGLRPTAIIDRTYFKSVYFREPGGVLFEIATLGPGFTIDEPVELLGEALMLPPQYEHLRGQLETELTPLSNPRQTRT